MAGTKYSESGFGGYYGGSTGPFRNDIAGNITGLTHQQLALDLAASVVFKDSLFDTDVMSFESDDWIKISSGDWATAAAGAGAGSTQATYGIDTTKHAQGVWANVTGTTATGLAGLYRGFLVLGACFVRVRQRNALTTLSTGGETFTTRFGLGDTTAAGEHVNGCFFRYSHGVNSGKFQAVTRAAGVETVADTGIAADTNYHIFEIQVNGAGTSVAFYIDSVLVATNVATIPVVSLYHHWKIEKSVGTTSRELNQDWWDLLLTRTAAR